VAKGGADHDTGGGGKTLDGVSPALGAISPGWDGANTDAYGGGTAQPVPKGVEAGTSVGAKGDGSWSHKSNSKDTAVEPSALGDTAEGPSALGDTAVVTSPTKDGATKQVRTSKGAGPPSAPVRAVARGGTVPPPPTGIGTNPPGREVAVPPGRIARPPAAAGNRSPPTTGDAHAGAETELRSAVEAFAEEV